MSAKALLSASVSAPPAVYVEDVFSTFLYTGNGGTQTITNGIALVNGFSITPGTALAGGFFAGFISHTPNGAATHALIVAPAATGATGTGYTLTTNKQWKTTNTSTAGTNSSFDGAANTAAMVTAGIANHPAAQFCTGLSIGGYTDWYLPARYELEIAYYNLKPTTNSNSTSYGINAYSVPARGSNYTAGTPAQTTATAFQTGNSEAFVAAAHWSSTEDSSTSAWVLFFSPGNQSAYPKDSSPLVRAFRKIPITDPLLSPYISVAGKGGLVWLKSRSAATEHQLFDTARGATKELISNSTAGEAVDADTLTAFNADGFNLGADSNTNTNAATYCSWTFRKAAKFFDVVTYTGTGANRTIAHNLGSVPGAIWVKRTETTGDWQCYHRSLANTQYMVLNSTAAVATGATRWNSTTPTSSVFSLGTDATVNASGGTYVAYLFAHDAGGFGDAGTDNVSACGTYTGNGSATGPTVTLNWEPQWLLVKRTDSTGDWQLIDNMRGFVVGGADAELNPNLSSAESTGTFVSPLSTGFQLNTTDAGYNATGGTYIYIAIRRGPMKTPTLGPQVFGPTVYTGNGTSGRVIITNILTDMAIYTARSSKSAGYDANNRINDRMRGINFLSTNLTNAESSSFEGIQSFDYMNAVSVNNINNQNSVPYVMWSFRRAPGFFDVVAYTGTGSARTVAHNLGVAPEMMIVKSRSIGTAFDGRWSVYVASIGAANYLLLNTTAGLAADNSWNSAAPSSTVFSLGASYATNQTSATYVAYLFATAPGVSKVGNYTGTGTTLSVDCGFTAGARFVLIKRTDSTGDWYAWDTARGIISGNDPSLLLNSTAAEVTNTDYIDPLSSGFQISSTAPAAINANGGSFIFLAIA